MSKTVYICKNKSCRKYNQTQDTIECECCIEIPTAITVPGSYNLEYITNILQMPNKLIITSWNSAFMSAGDTLVIEKAILGLNGFKAGLIDRVFIYVPSLLKGLKNDTI